MLLTSYLVQLWHYDSKTSNLSYCTISFDANIFVMSTLHNTLSLSERLNVSHPGYHGNHCYQIVCFCDEHAHMPLLPRQPFLEDCVFFV